MDQNPTDQTKKYKGLHVWMCLGCTRWSEWPGKCHLCGSQAVSPVPVRIEVANLQTLKNIEFLMSKLVDKLR